MKKLIRPIVAAVDATKWWTVQNMINEEQDRFGNPTFDIINYLWDMGESTSNKLYAEADGDVVEVRTRDTDAIVGRLATHQYGMEVVELAHESDSEHDFKERYAEYLTDNVGRGL